MTEDDLDRAEALAHRLADAASAETMARFRRRDLVTEDKPGRGWFDPVTEADRAAEAAIRTRLAIEAPDDAVTGEEAPDRAGHSGRAWVIDPIDGTRAFIAGLPTWGTLIALDDGRRWRLGLVEQPFTGERFVGRLGPEAARATLHRGGRIETLRCRPCPGLGSAMLFTTSPDIFTPAEAEAFAAVRARARMTRYGIDCYAYALVAMGLADLVIETALEVYDIAAPAALIRAAGGIVTDWQGGDPRRGGRTLAAGSPEVHAEALAILAEAPAG